MTQKVHDKPSSVSGEAGEVMVDGPDGVAVSLTPAAARETSARLRTGADEAEAALEHRPRVGSR
jgi:hypothetical protein